MPLAMAALPIYVHLPKFYGDHLGVNLTALGLLLLVLRLLDGILDPLLGALSDRFSSRKTPLWLAMPLLAGGMLLLFLPPATDSTGLMVWLAIALLAVYFAFSLATINHSAWGAEWSQDSNERTRITASRESLGLFGVIIAAVLPSQLGGSDEGVGRFAVLFAGFALLCTIITLRATPPAPVRGKEKIPLRRMILQPLADKRFRELLLVFLANGIASAIPATLVLFYISDVLHAQKLQGVFLALYFLAGAVGMPVWVKLARSLGKVKAWLLAMLLAVVAFVWAAFLGAGAIYPFAVICIMSGLALGADLALPPSLLADVIDAPQDPSASKAQVGSYFGLWTLTTKLNLAFAAGLALPLAGQFGYQPGSTDANALLVLALVYALLPCALKVMAGILLWRFFGGFSK